MRGQFLDTTIKESSPGKDVWDQVQKDKDARQAARLLWEQIEEETEEKITKECLAKRKKEYKDEDQACRNLFTNAPYWSRTWIIQEVVHSGEVVVLLSGGDYVALDELLNAHGYWMNWQLLRKGESNFTLDSIPALRDPNSSFPHPGLTEQQWYDRLFASTWQIGATKSHLIDLRAAAKASPIPTETAYPPLFPCLVMDFRDQEATDPRDKLYALLGMAAPNSNGADLVVDYRLTVRKLYTIATRRFLKNTLIALLLVESPKRPITPNGEFPSWVPNYCTKQNFFPQYQVGMQARFSADAGFPPAVEQEPRFRQASDEETLTLRGLYVGLATNTFDARFTSSADRDAVRLIKYDRDPALRCKNRNKLSPPDKSEWERPDPVKDSSWGPIHAEVGDWIIIVAGLKMPIVIRRVNEPSTSEFEPGASGERHLFVGECWLVESRMQAEVFRRENWMRNSGFSPIMFGSALQDLPESWKPKEFVLI